MDDESREGVEPPSIPGGEVFDPRPFFDRKFAPEQPIVERPEPSPLGADLLDDPDDHPTLPALRDPMRKAIIVITGDDDEDEAWLEERIGEVKTGIQAVLEIAWNWYEGRLLSRLHPGVHAWKYIVDHVGPLGKSTVVPLLVSSNWSDGQIAAVAGVSASTVHRLARNLPYERPPGNIGKDGRLRALPARGPIFTPKSDPIGYINPDNQRYAVKLKEYIRRINRVEVPPESEALADQRRALVEALMKALEKWLAEEPGGVDHV
jgi:hypothetical protein